MRNFFATLITLLVLNSMTFAQVDTVSMSTGYADQVFYSSVTGNMTSAPMMNWDLAFATHAFEVGIRVNDVNGVTLYKVPGLTVTGWAQVDTMGMSSWENPINSYENWMTGAFNKGALGMFDYGWGVYNPGTHDVVGDSLFVVELSNGTGPSTYKKLMIEKKSSANNYLFKYADLDGSNEVNVTIDGNLYSDKNFVYYSLRNGMTIDREPDTDDWNLTFTRYMLSIPGFGFYPVTGVLSNVGVEVAEARGIDVNTVQASTYANSYVSNISEIGDDWKSFGGMGFNVEDSLVYFIKSQDGGISKIRFLAFEGTATGVTVLERSVLSTSISEIKNSNLQSLAVYPTITSDDINVVYDLQNNSDLSVRIISLDGRVVYENRANVAAGFQNDILDVSSYSPGYYILSLTTSNDQLNSKFIISR